MSSVLVCISPAESHVSPTLDVARALIDRGHRVRVLTGARFADRIRALGADPLALPPEANTLDDMDLQQGRLRGRRAMNEGLKAAFLNPARAQLPPLQAALAAEATDAVVTDPTFLAAQMLGPERPVLAVCGIIPLVISSRDTAPFGLGLAPPRSNVGRLRNRLISWLARRVLLAQVHRDLDEFLAEVGAEGLGKLFFTDYMFQPGRIDLFAQFTVPAFEYPRSDLPDHVRFFGPLRPPSQASAALPSWWDDLDDSRPIVHVAQGTVGNSDFGELVAPTLEALADEPVTVVVSLGKADLRQVGTLPELPANALVADFLPYAELMPRLAAFVTNGGYGGLHMAMAAGVPIVVAGDTEDKVETSARVAWSGVGISLRTGRPKAKAVRAAVREVLANPSYRNASALIGRDIAASPGAAGMVTELERLIAQRAEAQSPSNSDPAG